MESSATTAHRLKSWEPDWAVHPGELLAEELAERHVTQATLARATKVSPKHVNEVIKGKAGIGAHFAIRLEGALGVSAQTWLNMQAAYDLHQARKSYTVIV